MSDKPLVVWCWACLLLWDLGALSTFLSLSEYFDSLLRRSFSFFPKNTVCLILVAIPASYSCAPVFLGTVVILFLRLT